MHTSGIVHRDIKPENVGFSPQGDARIIDFGISTAEAGAPAHLGGAPAGGPTPGTSSSFAASVNGPNYDPQKGTPSIAPDTSNPPGAASSTVLFQTGAETRAATDLETATM